MRMDLSVRDGSFQLCGRDNFTLQIKFVVIMSQNVSIVLIPLHLCL